MAPRSDAPAPPDAYAWTSKHANSGATPTPSSPPPSPPGSPARSAPAQKHTIRLALLYALADGERTINTEHLQAALALWDYTARSATWALQGATGDPLAEQIHATLHAHPSGLTRSQISDTLQHNRPAADIQRALDALALAGRATRAHIPTAGRPAELWTATTTPAA